MTFHAKNQCSIYNSIETLICPKQGIYRRFSDSKSVYFCDFLHCFLVRRETAKQFKKTKTIQLMHTWSDKAFKGTVVNRALQSLHGGSLQEIFQALRSSMFFKTWMKFNWFIRYSVGFKIAELLFQTEA